MAPRTSAQSPEAAAGDRERIVVIDDDYAIRLSCRQALTKSGYGVEVFEDGAQGIEAVADLKPDLVVVDLKMPGISGLEVISRIHEIDPNAVLIVITGYATIETAVDAMKCGAYDFLPKPFKPDELRLIVRRGLEHRRLLLETRRNEMERELLKRRFVSFVSHQLKSPLVAVHQYLDTMKRMGDTPEMAKQRAGWLDRCLHRTREMQQIIDDWLTLSGVERGCLSRGKKTVDLKEILQAILRDYRNMAVETGDVTLVLDMPEAAYPVTADPSCMHVLFDNLIENAIKYNRPGGSVTVSGRRQGDEILVEIVDTGIGIAEKHRPFVFDEFYRVRDDTGKKTEGSGLGLPICRHIVSEHGGRITLDSVAGAGSTFRVHLMAHRKGEDAGKPGSEADDVEVQHAEDTDG